MLILKLTSPEQKSYYVAARSRRPAARRTWRCSSRPLPGLEGRDLGDDIA
jgi:GTP-dependent phosphoenolpyruvate carboxykinase